MLDRYPDRYPDRYLDQYPDTDSDEGDRHPKASSLALGKFRDYCEVHNS